jgi:hypothetical protein
MAEQDAIRAEIELQRNPMPAGERSWVKVTVTNRGRTDVTWLHDTCASPATVDGVSAVAWPMGQAQPGNLGKFKAYALGGSVVGAPSPFGRFSFVAERHLGKGTYGCGDVAVGETLGPGEFRQETRWWSGLTDLNRGLAPAGAVTLSVSAGDYWRGKEPAFIPDAAIRFEVPAWITPSDPIARLSPGEIVDAALTDRAFACFIETQQIASGRASIAWYQADRDIWEVGILPWYETSPQRIHGVVVDARTGAVLGPLDREWKQDVDGMP